MYISKGVSPNSINSNGKTVKNIVTMKCMKRQLMFADENIAKKLKCTNTTEKYSIENDCTLPHQQLDVCSTQSHICSVASKCIQSKTCECKGLLHSCGISNVKTVKQCLPLPSDSTAGNFKISTRNEICSNTDSNTTICQQPDADVAQAHITSILTSNKQGCVCTCCHASDLQRCKCVLFIPKTVISLSLLFPYHCSKGTELEAVKSLFVRNVMSY